MPCPSRGAMVHLVYAMDWTKVNSARLRPGATYMRQTASITCRARSNSRDSLGEEDNGNEKRAQRLANRDIRKDLYQNSGDAGIALANLSRRPQLIQRVVVSRAKPINKNSVTDTVKGTEEQLPRRTSSDETLRRSQRGKGDSVNLFESTTDTPTSGYGTDHELSRQIQTETTNKPGTPGRRNSGRGEERLASFFNPPALDSIQKQSSPSQADEIHLDSILSQVSSRQSHSTKVPGVSKFSGHRDLRGDEERDSPLSTQELPPASRSVISEIVSKIADHEKSRGVKTTFIGDENGLKQSNSQSHSIHTQESEREWAEGSPRTYHMPIILAEGDREALRQITSQESTSQRDEFQRGRLEEREHTTPPHISEKRGRGKRVKSDEDNTATPRRSTRVNRPSSSDTVKSIVDSYEKLIKGNQQAPRQGGEHLRITRSKAIGGNRDDSVTPTLKVTNRNSSDQEGGAKLNHDQVKEPVSVVRELHDLDDSMDIDRSPQGDGRLFMVLAQPRAGGNIVDTSSRRVSGGKAWEQPRSESLVYHPDLEIQKHLHSNPNGDANGAGESSGASQVSLQSDSSGLIPPLDTRQFRDTQRVEEVQGKRIGIFVMKGDLQKKSDKATHHEGDQQRSVDVSNHQRNIATLLEEDDDSQGEYISTTTMDLQDTAGDEMRKLMRGKGSKAVTAEDALNMSSAMSFSISSISDQDEIAQSWQVRSDNEQQQRLQGFVAAVRNHVGLEQGTAYAGYKAELQHLNEQIGKVRDSIESHEALHEDAIRTVCRPMITREGEDIQGRVLERTQVLVNEIGEIHKNLGLRLHEQLQKELGSTMIRVEEEMTRTSQEAQVLKQSIMFGVDRKVEEVRTELGGTVQPLQACVQDLSVKVNSVIEEMSGTKEEVQKELDRLHEMGMGERERVLELKNQVREQWVRLGGMETQLEEFRWLIDEQCTGLKTMRRALMEKEAVGEQQRESIQSDIGTLHSEVGTLKAGVRTLGETVRECCGTNEMLNTVSGTVAGVQLDVTRLKEDVQQLNGRSTFITVQECKEDIVRIQSDMLELSNRICEVRDRFYSPLSKGNGEFVHSEEWLYMQERIGALDSDVERINEVFGEQIDEVLGQSKQLRDDMSKAQDLLESELERRIRSLRTEFGEQIVSLQREIMKDAGSDRVESKILDQSRQLKGRMAEIRDFLGEEIEQSIRSVRTEFGEQMMALRQDTEFKVRELATKSQQVIDRIDRFERQVWEMKEHGANGERSCKDCDCKKRIAELERKLETVSTWMETVKDNGPRPFSTKSLAGATTSTSFTVGDSGLRKKVGIWGKADIASDSTSGVETQAVIVDPSIGNTAVAESDEITTVHRGVVVVEDNETFVIQRDGLDSHVKGRTTNSGLPYCRPSEDEESESKEMVHKMKTESGLIARLTSEPPRKIGRLHGMEQKEVHQEFSIGDQLERQLIKERYRGEKAVVVESMYDWPDMCAHQRGLWIFIRNGVLIVLERSRQKPRDVFTGSEARSYIGSTMGLSSWASSEGMTNEDWLTSLGTIRVTVMSTTINVFQHWMTMSGEEIGDGKGPHRIRFQTIMEITTYQDGFGYNRTTGGDELRYTVGRIQVLTRGPSDPVGGVSRDWAEDVRSRIKENIYDALNVEPRTASDRAEYYVQKRHPGIASRIDYGRSIQSGPLEIGVSLADACNAEDEYLAQITEWRPMQQHARQMSSLTAILNWRAMLEESDSLEDFMTLGEVNNRYIRFLSVEIERVANTDGDKKLCFLEMLDRHMERSGVSRDEIRQSLDQSITVQGNKSDEIKSAWTAMVDMGAAITCISRRTAEQIGIEVKTDPRSLLVSGFKNEDKTTVGSGIDYAVFAIQVQGVRAISHQVATERILAIALVIDGLRYPILIGANLITKHAIADASSGLTFFQGEKQLIVNRLHWKGVERRITMKSVPYEQCDVGNQDMNHQGDVEEPMNIAVGADEYCSEFGGSDSAPLGREIWDYDCEGGVVKVMGEEVEFVNPMISGERMPPDKEESRAQRDKTVETTQA